MRKIYVLALMLLFSTQGFSQVIDLQVASVSFLRPEIITRKQLDRRVNQIESLSIQAGYASAHATPEDRLQILNAMIAEVLIRQGAEKEGITVGEQELDRYIAAQKHNVEAQVGSSLSDYQFRDLVTQQTGMSWEEYIRQLETQLLQQTYITRKKRNLFQSITSPTEAEIEEVHSRRANEFTNPEIIRFSQIYLSKLNLSAAEIDKAGELAEELARKLKNGTATFEELARDYSDDTTSKYRGGDFGYIARNDSHAAAQLGDSFFRKLFELEVGRISGVLDSNLGFHIVKVTEHRMPRLLKIDDPLSPTNPMTIRQYIRTLLLQSEEQRILKQAMDEIIAELKEQAEIRIFEENVN